MPEARGDENKRTDNAVRADRLEDLLEAGRTEEALELLKPLHPTDTADVIDRLPDELRPRAFDLLVECDCDRAADVLLELGEESLRVILADLEPVEISGLVRGMDSDDAADVVAQLHEERRADIISGLPDEDRNEVAELLKYPESSAGGIMRLEFVRIPVSDTVAEATDRVRRAAPQDHEPPIVYVVERDGRLTGHLRLRDLLRHPAGTPVRDIVRPVQEAAHVLDDQEQVAELARKYDYSTVAVLDEAERLAGIVTSDDILDVVVEEASEDIAKLGQTADLEDAFAPVTRSIRGRVPWLFVSLLGGMLASIVVLLFRSALEARVVVAAFMPTVAGMGGAAGNQATNIVVRALALGEVTWGDVSRLLWKQVRVGLFAGAATGLAAGTLAGAVATLVHGSPLLGGLVMLAMVLNVTVGSALGAMTPMLLARMGKDPALASSLLLTATTDMVGLFILLGLAALALRFAGF